MGCCCFLGENIASIDIMCLELKKENNCNGDRPMYNLVKNYVLSYTKL